MDLTRPSELKPLLHKHGLSLSKRFGQNFLVDRHHLMRVVDTAGVGPADHVLEIGPGVGTLTRELASRAARVVAVELDRHLLPVLADTLAPFAATTSVVEADALRLDLNELAQTHLGVGTDAVKIVANIPYNITSPLLVKFLETVPPFVSITLMVQKEVAVRLCAAPDAEFYGALTVFAQFYARVGIAGIVPRGAFFPPPKVDSAVVHFVPHAQPPVDVPRTSDFFLVSRAAFGQRRKTLFNALTNAPTLPFDRVVIGDALSFAGVDGNRRGETLSLPEIAAIARALPFSEHNAVDNLQGGAVE